MSTLLRPPDVEAPPAAPAALPEEVIAKARPRPPRIESPGDELTNEAFGAGIALQLWVFVGLSVVCAIVGAVVIGSAWMLAGPILLGGIALGLALKAQPWHRAH